MTKKICWSNVTVPNEPRVRFFVRDLPPGPVPEFNDVTGRVAKLVIETPDDSSAYFLLRRLDAAENLVWETRHPSLQETKWHVELEYALAEDDWTPF